MLFLSNSKLNCKNIFLQKVPLLWYSVILCKRVFATTTPKTILVVWCNLLNFAIASSFKHQYINTVNIAIWA